ncbi:MAG: uridine kinase [Bacteriovoracaceae bacterium]|nr:uridine kinase [Bacteriovoracaceae bacterium]
MKNLIIAVAGGSGSGKSFFSRALHKKLGDRKSQIIYQDNYYIDQSDKFDHDGGSVNFDHPDAIDFKLLALQLSYLKNNKKIDLPTYDFKTHSRLNKVTTICPKKVIIVDGILVLNSPYIRDVCDLMIFVETPEDIRFQRRLARDITERGRTPEGVRTQFKNQVKPMHDMYVEPSKHFAHIISSGTDMNKLNQILTSIETKLVNSQIKVQDFISHGHFMS